MNKTFLFKVDFNWADEMDLDGFMVLDQDEVNAYYNNVKRIKDFTRKKLISDGGYDVDTEDVDYDVDHYAVELFDLAIMIGSNESVDFDNLNDFLGCVTIELIPSEFADYLREHELTNTGFAHRFYNCLSDVIEDYEESDDDDSYEENEE